MAAIAMLAGCGAGASPSPTSLATPATTPTLTPPSMVATSPSPEPRITQPARPSPSPNLTVAPNGATVADLAGTWSGRVYEPGQPLVGSEYAASMTIEACGIDERCGGSEYATSDFRGTGSARTCRYDLTYLGYRADIAAFSFLETLRSGDDFKCAQAVQAAVTLLPSGDSIGQEGYYGGGWSSYGLLRRSSAWSYDSERLASPTP